MIHIIYDAQKLVNPTFRNTIKSIGEYPGEYKAILAALQSNDDYHCIVYLSPVFEWLKHLSQRYPQGTFVFETLDARQALAQKWDIALPHDLRNEEILESGLLQLDLHARPGQNFNDLLLAHFYAPLFSAKTFPFTQLPQLFQSIEADKWRANSANHLLARTLHQRMEAWKSRCRSTEQRQFIEWFADDPFRLLAQLMRFCVLRSYPGLGETLLGEVYSVLTALKPQQNDLAVDEAAIPDVVNQVVYHLNACSSQSMEDLEALLDQVSGLLWQEYALIEKRLQTHPEWITHGLVDRLESKFTAFSVRLSEPLAKLRGRIRPMKPQAPNPTWSVEQMLDWATRAYLPYQAWCSSQEEFDKDLYAIGDRFSVWLLEHWSDISVNSGRMVFNVLPRLAAQLHAAHDVHLVLVVDNFGWTFREILADLFREKGFYLMTAEACLAMLPTETEISKKCLLAATAGYTDISDATYKTILEKGWLPYLGDAFRYISDIGKLLKVDKIEGRAYIVNYLAVDKTLHKSSDEIGMSHRENVRHLLGKLVQNVAAFVEKHALADQIRVHVVSDHGSTQIPADLHNDLTPASFKQLEFKTISHRYVETSNERFAALPENLRVDCFFLPANDFKLPVNVLCARRANRFLPTDKDVWVHGGLLPEEVIVPHMIFASAATPVKDLTLLMPMNEFRYRLETVMIEIGNPNDFVVENVQISILNNNVEVEPASFPVLAGNHKNVLQMNVRFKQTTLPEEQTSLRFRVRFRCRGEMHIADTLVEIVMRKMIQEKSTDLFDD